MTGKLKACIVLSLDNTSWIIEKIAQRLAEHAQKFDIDAYVRNTPDASAAINHWMSYAFANEKLPTPSTMFITHIDDPHKFRLVKTELQSYVDLGICMSSHAVAELVHMGAPAESLTYVLPAHDNAVQPRRIVIGFTTRLYPDGRKREALLNRLAREMRLDAFRFDIFGRGWEKVVPVLEAAGAEVRYFPGTEDYIVDYREITAAIPGFDYYASLGMDEGSLGTLDALAAAVRTIVTPQGFHVDLPGGITHPVTTYEDVRAVFEELSAGWHGRKNAVATLSWEEYARRHALIWRAVVEGRKDTIPHLLGYHMLTGHEVPFSNRGWEFRMRAFTPRRLLSALGHIPHLKWLRARVKNLLK